MRSQGYSPDLRTALVLTGIGTAGSYHAGVLRAFREAGVKIDLIAGCGVGAVGALFTAVDGGQRLWETTGLWDTKGSRSLYRWKRSLEFSAAMLYALAGLLAAPLVLLAAALLVYPVGFFLSLIGLPAGNEILGRYGQLLGEVFSPGALPTFLPRLVTILVIVFIGVILFGQVGRRRHIRRRTNGSAWWRVLGSPLDASQAVRRFTKGLWSLIRGATAQSEATPIELSRRYSEMLRENLGQPGFCEIIMVAHDLDARRDLVFALLGDLYRRQFFRGQQDKRGKNNREIEVVDLGYSGQDHVVDALAACLSVPIANEPHLMSFKSESYWRGETHRVCDRSESVARLLAEVAESGVEQVIVVSASPRSTGPHGLGAEPLNPRRRLGESLAAAESASIRDALTAQRHRFRNVFRIQPVHNAVGPFDFSGCYDEKSDRVQTLRELLDWGSDDAYRQFIEPILGASGERLQAANPEIVNRTNETTEKSL